MSHPARIKDFS